MKLNEVRCPGSVPKYAPVYSGEHGAEMSCDSYEITFGLPTYKDREYDEVIIDANCDSCGHQFQVHGHVVVNKLE